MIKKAAPKNSKKATTGGKKSPIAVPMAVANWLIMETSLTFDQIADFCNIHPAVIHNIGNKDLKTSVLPKSPIGVYLTEEEIKRCEADKDARLRGMKTPVEEMGITRPKEREFISVARKRNRLDAAMWMSLFYPDVAATVVAKLVKSTAKMVGEVKKGTYRGMDKLVPKSPVVLGLCSKEAFEDAVKKFVPKEIHLASAPEVHQEA